MADFSAILGMLPDAVIVASPLGEVRWANLAAEELLDDRLDTWVGRSMLEAVHSDDHLIAMNACATVAHKNVGGLLTVRIRRRNGELVAVELRGRFLEHPDGDSIVLVVRRVDDRDGLELATNDITMLHRLVHHSPAMLAIVDGAGVLVSVNAAITRLLGHDPALICGRPLLELVDEADRASTCQLLASLDGDVADFAMTMLTVAGERRDFDVHATDLRAEAAVGAIMVSMTDVTDLRAAERRLRLLADTDPLTGLLNRRSFERRLDQLVTEPGLTVGTLFLDIDGFKLVNDIHGHGGGDQVLVETARRITTVCPPGSLIARVGGDEFLIAVPGDMLDIDDIASRISHVVTQPFAVGADRINVGASVGVAHESTPCDTRALIATADQQMYNVKRRRRLATTSPNQSLRPVHGRGLSPLFNR
jgi:diguanylate cyclase (GGDEF)-like protein/PAS domain S-box-containing protein